MLACDLFLFLLDRALRLVWSNLRWFHAFSSYSFCFSRWRLNDSHSPGGATAFSTTDANKDDRHIQNKTLV